MGRRRACVSAGSATARDSEGRREHAWMRICSAPAPTDRPPVTTTDEEASWGLVVVPSVRRKEGTIKPPGSDSIPVARRRRVSPGLSSSPPSGLPRARACASLSLPTCPSLILFRTLMFRLLHASGSSALLCVCSVLLGS
jgi:hypothetical protein